MIVYSIHVFKVVGGEGGKSALLMAEAYELSSFGFFSRDTAREVLRFGNRQVATFAQPGQREVVRLKNGASCHYGVGARGFACTVSTDSEVSNYPTRVAFSLLGKALDVFVRAHGAAADAATSDLALAVPEWETMLRAYQDPVSADPIARIERDLEDTKHVLVETLDELLARGEKLESLVDASQDLSLKSKVFLRQSEKLNSCCVIL